MKALKKSKLAVVIFFITISIISFTAERNAYSVVFKSEGWDSGTPPSNWPCKAGCRESSAFNEWYPSNCDQAATTGGPLCGLSTALAYSGSRSYYMYRAAGETDECDIKYTLPAQPSTLHVRAYYYFPSSSWGTFDSAGPRESNDTMVHFLFTDTAQSNTGLRINIRDGSNFHNPNPTGPYAYFLPQVNSNEMWTDQGRK
jgi:hypothetical protein